MAIRIVDPPGPNREAILRMLQRICPEASLQLNNDGTVRVTTRICTEVVEDSESIRNPCRCICDLISFGTTVRIRIAHDLSAFGGGTTLPDNPDDAVAGESQSGFGPGSDSEVHIENRGRYVARRSDNPAATTPEPDWLILAHELCGHALRIMRGDHPEWRPRRPGYTPNWHDDALEAGRHIRAFQDLPPVLEPPFVSYEEGVQ